MLNQNQLKEILHYEEDTGKFIWKISKKGTKGIGKEAGTLTAKGYIDVCINGKKYGLHRLAFIYMENCIPRCVDHINGNKSDNRWVNLREATYTQNGYNYKGTGSSTGFRNVYFDPRGQKKYFVRLVVEGKKLNFGYYDTPEEASEIALQKRIELHGTYCYELSQNTG